MDHRAAADELKLIQDVTEQSRRLLRYQGGGRVFLLWGAIWVVASLLYPLFPRGLEAGLWLGANLVGIAGAAMLYLLFLRGTVYPIEWRLVLSAMAVDLFSIVLGIALGLLPEGILLLALSTLALVLSLWGAIAVPVAFPVGFVTLILALIFYIALPDPDLFFLPAGLLGGGALILVGLRVRYQGEKQ